MIGIGLRVYSNSRIHYCIVEETSDEYIYHTLDSLVIPLSLSEPERLSYIRRAIIDIINEYKVTNALIRVRERLSNITNLVVDRFYIEGVVLEALASYSVNKYLLGRISSITPLLGIERAEFKEYVENEKAFDVPDEYDWAKLSKIERETILSCMAALNL